MSHAIGDLEKREEVREQKIGGVPLFSDHPLMSTTNPIINSGRLNTDILRQIKDRFLATGQNIFLGKRVMLVDPCESEVSSS